MLRCSGCWQQQVGLCVLIVGLLILIFCIPFWLWLTILGLAMVAFGVLAISCR